MHRRERLLATLRGESVDRPPVCLYELNGLDEHRDDPDRYNIYNHPSWRPLIDLARERSDRIVMRGIAFDDTLPDPLRDEAHETVIEQGHSRLTIRELPVAGRTLRSRTRRDADVNTVWTVEHLLKDADDLRALLDLPVPDWQGRLDPTSVLSAEQALGDTGIVMLDTPDPLCLAASLFDLGTYTIVAMTEPALFHRLLERFAQRIYAQVEIAARELPGRLWRIYGPEYASPPYLPPRLFGEYVVRYVTPMVRMIQRYGGYARIHCHGRLEGILDQIAGMGADGLDPIEPPPQGDVALEMVRRRYGRQMVLFGNLEVSEIEALPTCEFAARVRQALAQGTTGQGRGMVLMPSACPYGRVLPALTLRNYETMVEIAEAWQG